MSATPLDILTDLSLLVEFSSKENAVKNLKKKISELLPSVGRDIAEATLIPIGRANDPVAELDRRITTWKILESCRKEYFARGEDGFIIHNELIHAVKLNLSSEEDKTWAIENERKVMTMISESFIADHNLPNFEGHIVLFHENGFSGDLKWVTAFKKSDLGKMNLKSLFNGGIVKRNQGRKK